MPKSTRESSADSFGRLLRKTAPRALKFMAATMEDESVGVDLRIKCCKEILSRYDREEVEADGGTIRVELKGEAEDYAK
ncbi:MAG: hypothetical protein IKU72_01990 [Oscillospiraceae bacterium]|nr:hypothetical protein [Oscillospiraceae bacterium]